MQQLIRQSPTLSLALAMQALQAALDKALSTQVSISIAVVDAAGHMLHMAHMDGAPLLCRDIALNKARTAVSFGLPTNAWQERLERCSPAVRQGLPLQPGMALFGGGKPFRHAGHTIGAIGISGASEAVDGECARAALERVEQLLGLVSPDQN
ncbi:GlcG/HbpS family heme-binding protein [Pseudomonas yangonensis]|uniref:GlcG/HbpS family heme-binding protein n=1 Tax=Pseudomonas yangonensis TaxID=2579922 RepID=UPI00137AD736|nr:heme-binding protein [Pseudomonas yangonensis]